MSEVQSSVVNFSSKREPERTREDVKSKFNGLTRILIEKKVELSRKTISRR